MARNNPPAALVVLGLIACLWAVAAHTHAEPASEDLARLGRQLFFDTNLSLNRTQSCSTCHDPTRGFADARDNGVHGAASLGDDDRSLGDRNAATTAYAFLTPKFHQNSSGDYVGGLFHDGRAATLVEQASEPFVNPIEMRMPDPAAVVRRVRENPAYVRALHDLYGEGLFDEVDDAYETRPALEQPAPRFSVVGMRIGRQRSRARQGSRI